MGPPETIRPGETYGYLRVVGLETRRRRRYRCYSCRCACGRLVSVVSADLRGDRQQSCGCLRGSCPPGGWGREPRA